ncbi:MAG TPA: DUF2892 domain-containing protein [Ktedonobacterales bacterium]|nr:DUF2892 domain-containing protein [Ktedonobacterales bacterium]
MRREQNVGRVERGIRIAGGAAAALVGLVGLAFFIEGAANLLLALAFVALLLLGVDFVVTGVTGYCPLYHRLGFSTAHHTPQQG